MLVSTKGRYALRVMIDLAENSSGKYIPLKDIAKRQNVSLKYLEAIMSSLSKKGFVNAVHGKDGGYMLAKEPCEYTVASIIKATETSYALVACIEEGAKECERASSCKTLPMWQELKEVIDNYFESKKLSDFL